jgi:hypothetical protein
MKTKEEIMNEAKKLEGARKARTLTTDDVDRFFELVNSGKYKQIMVRAGQYVPNSYRYRAPMTVIVGYLADNGWTIMVGETDAKRTRGCGPTTTVVLVEHKENAWRGV